MNKDDHTHTCHHCGRREQTALFAPPEGWCGLLLCPDVFARLTRERDEARAEVKRLAQRERDCDELRLRASMAERDRDEARAQLRALQAPAAALRAVPGKSLIFEKLEAEAHRQAAVHDEGEAQATMREALGHFDALKARTAERDEARAEATKWRQMVEDSASVATLLADVSRWQDQCLALQTERDEARAALGKLRAQRMGTLPAEVEKTLRRERDEARARVAKLEAALRPFAPDAEIDCGGYAATDGEIVGSVHLRTGRLHTITVGMLRAARDALEKR